MEKEVRRNKMVKLENYILDLLKIELIILLFYGTLQLSED